MPVCVTNLVLRVKGNSMLHMVTPEPTQVLENMVISFKAPKKCLTYIFDAFVFGISYMIDGAIIDI